jgi:outer membrane murein-binding lipoprotein Lpp
MQPRRCWKILLTIGIATASFLLSTGVTLGQEGRKSAPSNPPPTEPMTDVHTIADLIRDLQAQVQALTSQVSELRTEQQRTSEQARELRQELDLARGPVVSASKDAILPSRADSPPPPASQLQTTSDRVAKLEEDQEITEARVNEQYQTKIESGSKYRLRLSGIVLLNLYDNRGLVDNQDFPQYAEPLESGNLFASPSSFGGSLRQSQVKLETFGPSFAGARTSADLQFDFAGGFPNTWNGAVAGLVRLRTGTIHLDWTKTSVVAGQDRLFFVPLAPTSLATLAIPALSYAGNLWTWTPQVRIEHRIALSDVSNVVFQAGILDSLTGDLPDAGNERFPSWGEESGQPAYAARVSWSHRALGQNPTIGFGGYYGRQNWGFNRNVDGWAGTIDLTLPLGKRFEFTGAFYRGRAVAGLGGGIGQSVLLTGSFMDPATRFIGLDSMGGWAQLKFKPRVNFEINAAIGVDNPFASEQRLYNANSIYTDTFSRNLSPLVNFIYQVRSDVLFSTEYRRLQTSVLDSGSTGANHVNLSLGYIF